MSLKALADKVLMRDGSGTGSGTQSNSLSHGHGQKTQHTGTVIPLPLTQDRVDDYQERAGIMQFDAADIHLDRQAAEAGAFENVIWLEYWRAANV